MIIRAITRKVLKKQTKFILYFEDGICLSIDYHPEDNHGYSTWGSYFGINDADFEEGQVNGSKIINWIDLPSIVQAHVEQELYQRGDI